MNKLWLFGGFIALICIGATSAELHQHQLRRYVHAQVVMEDLQHQEWQEDEARCLQLMMKVFTNVMNSTFWATWIWDSMQNPAGHLYGSKINYGNYDECMEFPWEKIDPDMRTQYCLTTINLSEANLEYDEVDFFGIK